MQQKIVALVSTLAVIAAFTALVTITGKEKQALLFSGLAPAAAGEITSELDGSQIPYTIRGTAIYVPQSQRDRLRLELATKGLPASNSDGYELLDTLNGFSTTADMFDAAYWRAKEGELTRTILSMPNVKSARVHLGVTRQSAFRRQQSHKSASVTVEAPMGLSDEQARSIQYLTALAVSQLSPEAVAVIDSKRGVIAGPGAKGGGVAGLDIDDEKSGLEYRLTEMLEAHVGMGNAKVSVAMDVNRTATSQKEKLIDPDNRQIASRILTEERDTEEQPGGEITVASNLADGDATEEPEDLNNVKRLRRNEQVVYTGTEIERVTEQAPGAITRMSIAVLLNERFTEDEEGNRIPQPRSEEELASLEALVTSAAGLDAERGDSLTLRTLPFEVIDVETAPAPTFVETHVLPRSIEIGQIVLLALLTIILGLFVVKPLLAPAPVQVAEAQLEDAQELPEDASALLTMLTQENPDDVAAILEEWFEEEAQPA